MSSYTFKLNGSFTPEQVDMVLKACDTAYRSGLADAGAASRSILRELHERYPFIEIRPRPNPDGSDDPPTLRSSVTRSIRDPRRHRR